MHKRSEAGLTLLRMMSSSLLHGSQLSSCFIMSDSLRNRHWGAIVVTDTLLRVQ